MYNFEASRKKMLEGQLLASNLVPYDVAKAVADIPREYFLPETMKSRAYLDEDILVSDGLFLISALSLARLVDVADISKTDTVLDLGCGHGYSTAVLSKLANMAVGVAKDKEHEATATKIFADLLLDNAVLVSGDPQLGLKEQAPYDVIFIAGAIEEIPELLLGQLANGGRLVTVCMHNDNRYGAGFCCYGQITKVIKKGRAFDKKIFDDILLPKAYCF